MSYSVETTKEFENRIKKLAKKYKNIKKDFEKLLNDFESGNFIGDAIKGFKNKVFKIRMRSSNMQKGKRGGFRIIYHLEIKQKRIILLTIYAKVQKKDIKPKEIKAILKNLGLNAM